MCPVKSTSPVRAFPVDWNLEQFQSTGNRPSFAGTRAFRRLYSAMTFALAVGPTPTAKRCTSRADGAIREKVIAL
jgi:hypothetical protein